MDNPQEFTQEHMAMRLLKMECPRCYRKAADMRNTGFSAARFRRDNPGQCFWFNDGTFECNNG